MAVPDLGAHETACHREKRRRLATSPSNGEEGEGVDFSPSPRGSRDQRPPAVHANDAWDEEAFGGVEHRSDDLGSDEEEEENQFQTRFADRPKKDHLHTIARKYSVVSLDKVRQTLKQAVDVSRTIPNQRTGFNKVAQKSQMKLSARRAMLEHFSEYVSL